MKILGTGCVISLGLFMLHLLSLVYDEIQKHESLLLDKEITSS